MKNATIESTMLGFEDHGILTFMITVTFGDNSIQGFGGYVLHHEHIKGILNTLEVGRWEDLKGVNLRVELSSEVNSTITKIGHISKDQWFDPKSIKRP